MLYIQKMHDSEVDSNISAVKRQVNWNNIDKNDTKAARSTFDQLDKELIRKRLCQEQKGICAYCMRRIDSEHSVIEHYIPIEYDGSKALEYSNLLLCCDGGQKKEGNPHVLSCDAAKGNQIVSISPLKKENMDLIRYRRNGQIYTYPKNEGFERDINNVLNLNGILDENGNTIIDTANSLVFGRKQAVQNYEKMIRELQKRHKCTKEKLTKIYHQISNENPLPEHAGVWLYFLHKAIRRLP